MQVAVVTFDGYNELDSFVAATIINRLRPYGWRTHITAPTEWGASMNGVTVQRQRSLAFVKEADVVLIGSGIRTRDIADDSDLLVHLRLDSGRQLVAAQCSGTLLLAKLGIVEDVQACTSSTMPWVIEAAVKVIDAPLAAHGNVATAGGCLAAPYLAAWIIARGASIDHAREALHYVAPVGEKSLYVDHVLHVIEPALLAPAQMDPVPPVEAGVYAPAGPPQ